MTDIPEIERIVAASHIADGERVVFVDVAKHAVRSALDRQAREIVEALMGDTRWLIVNGRHAPEDVERVAERMAENLARFARKDESDD